MWRVLCSPVLGLERDLGDNYIYNIKSIGRRNYTTFLRAGWNRIYIEIVDIHKS